MKLPDPLRMINYGAWYKTIMGNYDSTLKCEMPSRPATPCFVDVFAGCGGLSLGLMQAGWKGLFAIERDINAFQTLHDNLATPNAKFQFAWPEWLPKTNLDVADVLRNHREGLAALAGKVSLLAGGPPCQGFSCAGRRNPSDPRNRLMEAYLEFVQLLKPEIVLIENVRGITSDFNDGGSLDGPVNYAKWLTASLSADYAVSSAMVNTSLFGVPQKRHRYFVIAFRKDVRCPLAESPFALVEQARSSFLRLKGISAVPVSAQAALSDLEVARNGKTPSRDSYGFEDIGYIGPLTSYQRIMNKDHRGLLPDTRLARHKAIISDRFAKIIDLCHAEGRLSVSLSAEMRAAFGLRKSAIRVLDPDSPSPTITSMPDDLIHYTEPRALTVRETARLQSFPDWFTFKGKYTTGGDRRRREVPRFTQVANAVPPLVAEAIGATLLACLTTPAALTLSVPQRVPQTSPDAPTARA